MDSISQLFLRAKHWQLFLLFFGIFFVGNLAAFISMSSMSALPQAFNRMAAITAGITVPFMFCFLGWLWSTGSFCSSLVRPAQRLSLRFFRFAVVYPGLYIVVFFALFLSIKTWALAVILPLHFFAVFCVFYDLYFVSKTLVLAETGRANSFYHYAGPFFLLWFFPVGVWIIQPRINGLYFRGVSPLPVTALATSVPGPSAEESPAGILPTYAGFWRRCGAALIDMLLIFFPLSFVTIATYSICRQILAAKKYNSDWALLAWPVVSVIFTLCYFALLECSQWRATPGKKALGLCVSDMEGRRLTLGRAVGRTLAKYVSCLTIGVGFLMCGFTKKKQALHDMIARCLVLRPSR